MRELIYISFHYAGILNSSTNFTVLDGPEVTITVNETNGGSYDCIAFNDTDYAVSTGYLFVNPVVDDQLAENMSEVTFVCEFSFPTPDGDYVWMRMRDLPLADNETLNETGQNLTISVTVDLAGSTYFCSFSAVVKRIISYFFSRKALLTGKASFVMQDTYYNIEN